MSWNIKFIMQTIKASNIAQRIASGAFWSVAGTAIAKFIVLFASIFCAQILGKEQFGEFGIIRSTINLFVAIGVSGLGLTATKYISEYLRGRKEQIPYIYILTQKFSLLFAILITIAIYIFAPTIATDTLSSPFLINDIRLGSILLFFTVLNAVQYGILSGFEEFKIIALNTLWGNIVESILMIIGAKLYAVSGAIIGFGIGFIIIYILNNISIRRILEKHQIDVRNVKLKKEHYLILLKFSIPAALSSLMITPVVWLTQAILVREAGYGEVAIYEAANQWRTIILFIPSSVCQVVLPILSSVSGKNSTNTFWKILNFNIILNGSIAIVLTVCVYLFGDWIMGLYGKGFIDKPVILLLAGSTIFSSISTVIGLSITSKNKMWTGFMFNLIWASLLLMFSYIFISKGMGASGLALAMFLSYFIHSIYQYIYLKYITRNCTISENI